MHAPASHKGRTPVVRPLWSDVHFYAVGSTGLALLHEHMRRSAQLANAPSTPRLDEAWHRVQLPTSAQTLDLLLSAPAHMSDSIGRFKTLIQTRMTSYLQSFNPALFDQSQRVHATVDGSLFVPTADLEGRTNLSWTNQLVRHVLEVDARPAANLGPQRITVPSHLGHGRHPPAAYASVFNLVLLDQLSTDNSENEMCEIANFPRIAHDVLTPDDYQQRNFFHEFKHWVLQVLGEPETSNKLVVDTLGWLRRESPQLREMDAEDLRRYGADMGRRVKRALRRVVELLRDA